MLWQRVIPVVEYGEPIPEFARQNMPQRCPACPREVQVDELSSDHAEDSLR